MKYELTLTLKGDSVKRKSTQDQFNYTSPKIQDVMKGFKYSMIAELHANDDVHYHAYVELSDHKLRNTLLNRLKRLHFVGRLTCSQVIWENSYMKYMVKDLKKTEEILGTSPIVRDELNIIYPHLDKVTPDQLDETIKECMDYLTPEGQVGYVLNKHPELYYCDICDLYYSRNMLHTCDPLTQC